MHDILKKDSPKEKHDKEGLFLFYEEVIPAMKKGITFVLALVICLSLCACGHQHTWKSATCTEPKTCTKCGETEGSALGHSWEKATCTEPKTCSRCGKTEGTALGHSWKKQTETTPKMCTKCGEMEPMPLPKTGTVFLGKNISAGSEITIKTSD